MVGDDTWLTTGEAAERLQVSVDAVRRAIRSGRLRSRRTPGGHRRISAASVDALARDLERDESGPVD